MRLQEMLRDQKRVMEWKRFLTFIPLPFSRHDMVFCIYFNGFSLVILVSNLQE